MIRLWLAIAALLMSLGAQGAMAAEPSPFENAIGSAKGAMMAEPDKALVHATEAAKIAAATTDARERAMLTAQADWLRGEALTRINRPEAARPVIAGALATVIKLDPRSKLNGDLLMSDAAISKFTGNLPKALGEYQAAYAIFTERGEARSQAKVLQEIGTIYFDARDYPRVLKYYAESAEVYKGDPALTIAAYNNIGDTLKEMRRFKEAERNYRQALKIAREIESPFLEVRILTNIASALYLSGDLAGADATADRGLQLAKGQDTGWEPFLWGVKAQTALARKDYAATRRYLDLTFAGTNLAATTLTFREFHETAYKLFAAIGDEREALIHLTAFKRLDDEAREVAASTNAALMGARFDFANQELSIAKLKAGQLQRDVEIAQSRARIQYGALAVAAIMVIGTLLAFFSIRRSRNEVRAANATLSEVNGELSEALAAKTRFLATTSHEIRTPLNGILGMTQLMLHDRTLPDGQRDRVQVVYDAGNMMKALVDDILDVAKIETGNLTIEHVEVDLHPLLQGVARLWADEAVAKGLTFDIALYDCPARMIGDPRRLRQIVFNLMSNAVKFTDEGSVRVSAAAEDADLVIRVADTGIGIADEQHEVVFESFHQVDGELTRKHGGTGLGLAICRELAHAMGGTVEIESKIGKGSTFTLRLPIGCVPILVAADSLQTWPATLSEASILVVEPNALTRSILTASLSKIAARVRGIDAEEIASASAERPNHIVADITALGEPSEVAALAGPSVRITILAAEMPPTDRVAALLEAGANQVLKRPIPVAELVAALGRAHGESAKAEAIAA